ncbi:MAG: Trm112 family protein [Syntrophotaleaceae bacterium]
MKPFVLELLICPKCLPQEFPLHPHDLEIVQRDIVSGELKCLNCDHSYPIREGIACLTRTGRTDERAPSKYETPSVLASYLWSHYGDLLNDPDASQAYGEWAALVKPTPGLGIDIGAAVGRFSFEMGHKCQKVLGIDNSYSFVKAARELLLTGQIQIALPMEGRLS